MPTTPANGIDITYATHGDPAAPPLLTIHGLGAQMTDFPAAFVDAMVDAGFHVITFDNRDQGGSTWFDDAGVPDIGALLVDPAIARPLPDRRHGRRRRRLSSTPSASTRPTSSASRWAG